MNFNHFYFGTLYFNMEIGWQARVKGQNCFIKGPNPYQSVGFVLYQSLVCFKKPDSCKVYNDSSIFKMNKKLKNGWLSTMNKQLDVISKGLSPPYVCIIFYQFSVCPKWQFLR